MKLGDDFDKRVLAEIERPVVKARKLTLYSRFMPLFKAAAMMLLLFTLGGVVKHATEEGALQVLYMCMISLRTDRRIRRLPTKVIR